MPFVLYALADKRHGHVVRMKKHYAKSTVSPANGLAVLSESTTMKELGENWGKLSAAEKNLPVVLAKKEALKKTLK